MYAAIDFLKAHWLITTLVFLGLIYFGTWAMCVMAKWRDNALNESYWRKLNEVQRLFRNSDRYPSDDMKRKSVKDNQ